MFVFKTVFLGNHPWTSLEATTILHRRLCMIRVLFAEKKQQHSHKLHLSRQMSCWGTLHTGQVWGVLANEKEERIYRMMKQITHFTSRWEVTSWSSIFEAIAINACKASNTESNLQQYLTLSYPYTSWEWIRSAY